MLLPPEATGTWFPAKDAVLYGPAAVRLSADADQTVYFICHIHFNFFFRFKTDWPTCSERDAILWREQVCLPKRDD